jgi:hypothetical protein
MGWTILQGLMVDFRPLHQLLRLPEVRGSQAVVGGIADLIAAPLRRSDGGAGRGDDHGSAGFDAG